MYYSYFSIHLLKYILVACMFLVIMNKTVINIHAQVLWGYKFSPLMGIHQGLWLLDGMVKVCLVWWKTAQLSCGVAVSFSISQAMSASSCCTASSPAFGVISGPDIDPSNQLVILSRFNLHFPGNTGCEASCHMLICHVYIFNEMFVKVFSLFLIGLFLLLLLSFKSSLYTFDGSLQ